MVATTINTSTTIDASLFFLVFIPTVVHSHDLQSFLFTTV